MDMCRRSGKRILTSYVHTYVFVHGWARAIYFVKDLLKMKPGTINNR